MGQYINSGIWTDELRERVLTLHATHSSSQVVKLLGDEGLVVTRNMVIGLWNRAGLKKPLGYKPTPVRTKPRKRPELQIIPGVPGNIGIKRYAKGGVPDLRCVPLEPQHISLFDLNSKACRYPYGDGPFTFCGHPPLSGKPYCASHNALAYTPVPVRRETPKPFFREGRR